MDDDVVAAQLPVAKQLAAKIAWLPEHQDDLIQTGLTALLAAARKQTAVIENPEGFAYVVMRRAMQDFYSRVDREDLEVQPPDDDLPVYIAVVNSDAFERLMVQEYFEAVQRELGSRAARIARELYCPCQEVRRLVDRALLCPTCQEYADECCCEIRHRSPGRVCLRPIVRSYLGIREDRWPTELKRLRHFTRSWLEIPGSRQRPPLM